MWQEAVLQQPVQGWCENAVLVLLPTVRVPEQLVPVPSLSPASAIVPAACYFVIGLCALAILRKAMSV